jgi:transposase
MHQAIRKTNKNDYIDAEAIAEAVGRPRMRFVPIKSEEQLDLQSFHRVRDRWVRRRTSLINQIRGLLLERGITIRQGRRHVEAALPGILEDADSCLSGPLRTVLAQLQGELRHIQSQIEQIDEAIMKAAGDHEACRRLMTIPGVGSITATAVVAAIANGVEFRKGRAVKLSPTLVRQLRMYAASAKRAVPVCGSTARLAARTGPRDLPMPRKA